MPVLQQVVLALCEMSKQYLRAVHKCTLAVPARITANAVNRLKKLRGVRLRITYIKPFTRDNPIELQVFPNGNFVTKIISEQF